MASRPKWVIGWAEDDDTPGAHGCVCLDLQLWVERMFANSLDAYRYGCEGMMAIHWQTAAMTPNIMALAQAGWDFEGPAPDRPGALPESDSTGASNAAAQARTSRMPALDTFWADWGRGTFGGTAGAEAGGIMRQTDGPHVAINAPGDAAATPRSGANHAATRRSACGDQCAGECRGTADERENLGGLCAVAGNGSVAGPNQRRRES